MSRKMRSLLNAPTYRQVSLNNIVRLDLDIWIELTLLNNNLKSDRNYGPKLYLSYLGSY